MGSDLPVLVACAHGTRGAAGRRALAELRLAVERRRPGLSVLAANADVEVQRPGLRRVLDGLGASGTASVVVPLLLSSGYHVEADVNAVVAAAGGPCRAGRALGPDALLVDVLADRLSACGTAESDAVVLVAAGSSRPAARRDVEWAAEKLGARRGRPVPVGYLSGTPALDTVLERARAGTPRTAVTLACYLLAPSAFADRLQGRGAARVSAPLAPHPLLTDLVLRRYDEALAEA